LKPPVRQERDIGHLELFRFTRRLHRYGRRWVIAISLAPIEPIVHYTWPCDTYFGRLES